MIYQETGWHNVVEDEQKDSSGRRNNQLCHTLQRDLVKWDRELTTGFGNTEVIGNLDNGSFRRVMRRNTTGGREQEGTTDSKQENSTV